MNEPWREMIAERNAARAAADAEAERQEESARSRARLFRAIYWLGLLPFIAIALFIMHESAWFDGYATGWRAGKSGQPFNELP